VIVSNRQLPEIVRRDYGSFVFPLLTVSLGLAYTGQMTSRRRPGIWLLDNGSVILIAIGK